MQLPKWKTISSIDLVSVRCSIYATILMFVSALILFIAFVTPYWLDSESFPDRRFRRLGLWEACFDKFQDQYYRYDQVIRGCKWIFDEDYTFILDFLEPSLRQISSFKGDPSTCCSTQDRINALIPCPGAYEAVALQLIFASILVFEIRTGVCLFGLLQKLHITP